MSVRSMVRRFGAAMVAVLWVALASAGAQDPPERGDRDDPQTFFRRFLKVRNITQEKVFVFIQYRTFQKDIGKWVWHPAGAPQIKNAQAIEIPSGEEVALVDLDVPLSASRARLWAQSDNLTWEKHREFDLWLVPEVQDGEHRYVAEAMETFTYFLAAPQDPNADPDAVTMPINAEMEFAQPRVAFVPPPAPGPNLPQQQVVFMPEVQQVVDPLPPLVVPPLEPNIVLVREADLFVARFNIDASGAFSALIGNRGPASFRGGRRWALLRAGGLNQPYRPVLEGWIDRIPPGGFFQAWGAAVSLTDGSRFALAISPGDANPANDTSGIVFTAPPRADLAVSAINLRDNSAFVSVTNLGPSDFRGGFRTLTIADQQRAMTMPQSQGVGPLAVGQTTVLQFPMRPNFAPNNRLMAILNAGDPNRRNDFSDIDVGGGGVGPAPQPVGRLAEYRVGNLRVEGRTLVGDVTCISDGVRMPRQFMISYESTGRFPRRDLASGAIQTLAVGQSQTAQIALPFDPAARSFNGTLALESARRPSETTTRFFGSGGPNPNPNPPAGSDFDLAVVRLSVDGGRAVGIIKNVGNVPYAGGARWDLSAVSNVGPQVLENGRVGALDVGQIQRVELTKAIPANQRFLKLRLDFPLGAPANDTNPNNNSRDFDLSVMPTTAQLRISDLQEAGGMLRAVFEQTPAAPAQLSGQWEYELGLGSRPPQRGGATAGLTTIPKPLGGGIVTLKLFNTPTGGRRVQVDSRELQLGGNRPPIGAAGQIVVANDRVNGNTLAWTFNVNPAGAKLQGSWVYKLVKDGVDVPGAEGTINAAMLGREQTFNFPQGRGLVFIQWMNFLPGQTTPASDQKSQVHTLGRGPRPRPTPTATSPDPNPPGAPTLAIDESTLRVDGSQLKWRFKVNPAGGQLPPGWTYRVFITSPGGSTRIAPIPVTQQMLSSEMTYAIPAGATGTIQVEVNRASPLLSLRTAPLKLGGNTPPAGPVTVSVDESSIRMVGTTLSWKFQTQPAGGTLEVGAWTYRVIINDNGERPSVPRTVTQQMVGVDTTFSVPSKASGTVVIELQRSNPTVRLRTRPFRLFAGSPTRPMPTATQPAGGADLAVTAVALDPNTRMLTYTIKNIGPDRYSGGRSISVGGSGWIKAFGQVPPLESGSSHGPAQLDLSEKINSIPANQKFQATVTVGGADANDRNNKMTSNEITTGGGNMGEAPALFIKSASLNRATGRLTVTIGNSGGAYPPTARNIANINYQIKVRYPRDVSFRDMGNTRNMSIAKNGEATTQPNPVEMNHLPPGAQIRVELNAYGTDGSGRITSTLNTKDIILP